jgi:hypothetical protein
VTDPDHPRFFASQEVRDRLAEFFWHELARQAREALGWSEQQPAPPNRHERRRARAMHVPSTVTGGKV